MHGTALNGKPSQLPVENSPSAFRAAIGAGFGIELDVQMTRDRQALVFHDAELGRLTGRDGRVVDLPLSELTEIPYLSGSDTLMSLEACLSLIDGRVPLLIEVKSQWSKEMAIERHLAHLLSSYNGEFGVMSFDPLVIERLQELWAQGCYGLVTSMEPDDRWSETQGSTALDKTSDHLPGQETAGRGVQFQKAFDLNVDFIAHDIRDPAIESAAQEVSAFGASLFCWTVRTDEQLTMAAAIGAIPIFEGGAVKDSLLKTGSLRKPL
ncbi:MAG: phosphodiesterase [Rhodomicrobium sp.]|nr:MAG: phosphodiesterase [Rhodomicrobium sp.]